MRKFFLPCLLCMFSAAGAQETTGTRTFINRENLTRYYKAAVNANFLSSENGEYAFSASWFGVRRIFNNTLDIDGQYLTPGNRMSRNLNIDLTFVPGEQTVVKRFEPSLSYAFINNRDATEKNKTDYRKVDDFGKAMSRVSLNTVRAYQAETAKITDRIQQEKRNRIEEDFKKQWNEGEVTLKEMDPELREIFRMESKKIKDDFSDLLNGFPDDEPINIGIYDRLWEEAKDRISRRALARVEFTSAFENHQAGSLSATITYLKGLNAKNVSATPWDFEGTASFFSERDTLPVETSKGMNRVKLALGANINKVLIRRKNESEEGEESILELKGGVDYMQITRGLYENEKEKIFNFTAVLTVRLTKDLYIPFTLKYDPEEANFVGIFKIEYNIGDTDKN
jgi:hypothetical protein